jgi:hypothetical protein
VGFRHFVTSMPAPVASGWSGRRVGLAPTGKAPPCHGARGNRTLHFWPPAKPRPSPAQKSCRLSSNSFAPINELSCRKILPNSAKPPYRLCRRRYYGTRSTLGGGSIVSRSARRVRVEISKNLLQSRRHINRRMHVWIAVSNPILHRNLKNDPLFPVQVRALAWRSTK